MLGGGGIEGVEGRTGEFSGLVKGWEWWIWVGSW